MLNTNAGRPSWSMRFIGWLFRSERERVARVQAELTGKAYFLGLRDGRTDAVSILDAMGATREARAVELTGLAMLAGLETRDQWPRSRVVLRQLKSLTIMHFATGVRPRK